MDTIDIVDSITKKGSFMGMSDLAELFMRYGINAVVVFILVMVIYYPRHKNKDFVFTFFLFNTVNFLICFLLSSTKLKIGFAFGLFAIFSILRYRTVTVPIREMGYFFVSVTIGIINALAELETKDKSPNFSDFLVGIAPLATSNVLVLVMIYLLDRQLSIEHENYKEVNYERIDLIKPDRREEMMEDLRKRTGLPVHRIELIKVDFLRDVARIHAFYYSQENESTTRGIGDDDD